VEPVVDLAAAPHEHVYDADPKKFPEACTIALQPLNNGVVKVVVDG
jgi:hypothetical protein